MLTVLNVLQRPSNNNEKTLANLVVPLNYRQTTRFHAEASSIWVCLDTSSKYCSLCKKSLDSSFCQHTTFQTTLL